MTVVAGVLAREEEVVHLEVREMGERAKVGDSEAAAVAVKWVARGVSVFMSHVVVYVRLYSVYTSYFLGVYTVSQI